MAKKFFGSIALQDQQGVLFFDADNSNKITLKAPATVASDVVLTLPDNDGAAGQALITDGSGVLSWTTKVSGPGSATDNAVVRFDGTTGALIQDSSVVIDDSNNITGVVDLTMSGNLVATGDVTADEVLVKTALKLEETGAGTDTITLQAPASITASYSLTLPADDGAANQVLATDGAGILSWATLTVPQSYKTNWVTADTATKVITHSLASTDVMVQIFDVASGESIEIDEIERTDANTVTVVASSAPPATNWRVLILAI
jgi:hypothetical protein